MKKLFSSLLLAVITLSFFSVLLLPSFAGAQVSTPEPGWKGIVPCGRNTGTAEEQAPCTLCHLIVGFQRLVQYGMYMVVTLALVGIFFAGVMYIISSGDENMMTQAKGFLKVSLIGFSVVIGAWLIVNVTMWVLGAREGSDEGGVLGIKVEKWNKFTCDTKSSQGTGGTVNNNSSSGQLTCGTNSPGSCKAECDTSVGEVVASQYSCSTGKCCLPAPNSVTCVSKGYSCVDVSKCTAENFYAASCNNGGPISLVCCKKPSP